MEQSRTLPSVEAHRGASAECPENTLCAFRRAVELGAPSIELDIHVSRDGELVVMHDETVKRTTGSEGRIAELTLAELRRLECGAHKHARFAGEPVPTLAEALALTRAHGVCYNVEVKAFSSPQAPERLVSLLREFAPPAGTHVVSSFALEALLQVRQAEATVPLALLGEFPAILEVARQHGIPWVHGQSKGVTAAGVAAAHAAGLRVMVWTVNEPALFAYCAGAGVDKVCTDDPATMLGVRRTLAAAFA
jgi:glycerophosphoryl diester phosphodiesterase